MLSRTLGAVGLAAGLLFSVVSRADCVDGITVAEAQEAYASGQTHERDGRAAQAVVAYLRAQGYVCGKDNPVARDAAGRAAPLARKLAQEQERQGNVYGARSLREYAAGGQGAPGAFQWYEAGGHFADADRVLIGLLRAKADDLAIYDTARTHFEHRALPSFQSNERVRLAVTGAYAPDAKVLAELRGMPAAGVERALNHESRVFSEDYLREFVERWQQQAALRPSDFAAMQRAQQAEQAFRMKWRQDPLELSLRALEQGREWAVRAGEGREPLEAKLALRLSARAELIADKYAAAPELLQAAVDYYYRAEREDRAEQVRRQADRLGDQAMAAQQYRDASAYYQVSGDTDKAGEADLQAEEALEAEGAQRQEAARQQAEQMRKLYADPARVEAMRRQAEAAMRQGQPSPAQQQQFQRETDTLEGELELDE